MKYTHITPSFGVELAAGTQLAALPIVKLLP